MNTPQNICFIGFGEAAEALSGGFSEHRSTTWDIKQNGPESAQIEARVKLTNVAIANSCEEAVSQADWIISLVTADQAQSACIEASKFLKTGAYYFEMNSCSPGTKKANASIIGDVGGHLIDIAIMSPVNPSRLNTPLLFSGPNAEIVEPTWSSLGYNTSVFGSHVGEASAVKMTRSIMIKGLEALSAECLLTARELGIENHIINSLNKSFEGFDWGIKGGYNLERMLQHGIRRAAEMREVVNTIKETGLPCHMTESTVVWQQLIGDLKANPQSENFEQLADYVRERIRN